MCVSLRLSFYLFLSPPLSHPFSPVVVALPSLRVRAVL